MSNVENIGTATAGKVQKTTNPKGSINSEIENLFLILILLVVEIIIISNNLDLFSITMALNLR